MDLIDLHVHTTASDGTMSPAEVVEEAQRRNIKVIAITDHDTTKGIEEAVEAAKGKNLEVVPGVEISCFYGGREIHMLGLFIDPSYLPLEDDLIRMREVRKNRTQGMIDLLNQDGIMVTLEQLKFGKPDTVVSRAHFGRFLVQEGYAKSMDEAFKKYIGEGCKYYLPRQYLDTQHVINLIHAAGGLAFLAHPYLYNFKEVKVKGMISDLKKMGLDGVEAYHSTTDQGRINQLREYAKENELLVCGGSDFHGINKPYIHLGTGKGNLRVTMHVFEKIINRQV